MRVFHCNVSIFCRIRDNNVGRNSKVCVLSPFYHPSLARSRRREVSLIMTCELWRENCVILQCITYHSIPNTCYVGCASTKAELVMQGRSVCHCAILSVILVHDYYKSNQRIRPTFKLDITTGPITNRKNWLTFGTVIRSRIRIRFHFSASLTIAK